MVKIDELGTVTGSNAGIPAKLSAGAKHMLKPDGSEDRGDARLTHSSIPFTSGISSDTVPINFSHKIAGRDYRFYGTVPIAGPRTSTGSFY